MAFSALTDNETSASKPTKQELFRKIQADLNDLNDRTQALENAALTYNPIEFVVKGPYYLGGAQTGVAYKRIPANLQLSTAYLFTPAAGSAGTLEIDILYSRAGGAFTTIFSTKPSLVYTAGALAVSSNGVLLVTDLLAGDVLRLDLVQGQTDQEEFQAILEFSAN